MIILPNYLLKRLKVIYEDIVKFIRAVKKKDIAALESYFDKFDELSLSKTKQVDLINCALSNSLNNNTKIQQIIQGA